MKKSQKPAEPQGSKLKILVMQNLTAVTASDNESLSRRARTASRHLIHCFPANCSFSSLFGREVEFHFRDCGIISQTAGVFGHLQINVAFLTPGGCPAVPHNPIWCRSCGVQTNCHH